MESLISSMKDIGYPLLLIGAGFLLGITWDEISPKLKGPENRKAKRMTAVVFIALACFIAALYINT